MVDGKTDKHMSWAAHGVDEWYLSPATDHYQCYRVYATNTRDKHNSETVEFYLQHTKVPRIAAIDASTTASQQLVTALSNPKSNT